MTTDLPPVFPPELRPLATEIRTYFRELPRLLEECHDHKFVVVKGEALYGVWDTQMDAIRAGRMRFPDGQFLAQEIGQRYQDLLGGQFAAPTAGVQEVA